MAKLTVSIFLLFLLGASLCYQGMYLKEDPRALEQWNDFLQTYKKGYNSIAEEKSRFQIFKDNLELIKWMQSRDQDATYGVTKFADLTPHEFRAKYLGARINKEESKKGMTFKPADKSFTAPDKWDWREYKAVSPVKDQGACGSCWAFSTIGNIEGQYFIKYGKMYNMSTQQLVDCDKQLNMGCHGGWMENAFRYMMMNGGLESVHFWGQRWS